MRKDGQENKCNKGYAFINLTEPASVIPFYQAFNRMQWVEFNCRRNAAISCAKMQGKAAPRSPLIWSNLKTRDKHVIRESY
ncbi:Protein MEI2-like 4 [Camellia lanceoleosa]|uniref:Protein MEI2-like 4 n=1 Tax=Camellia lanceoleosa TaxID=1840588 RepID=A0ACC0I6Z8_9ERIC|nr:Protein MEI2-like 4 [Camellia lanceoleosa]